MACIRLLNVRPPGDEDEELDTDGGLGNCKLFIPCPGDTGTGLLYRCCRPLPLEDAGESPVEHYSKVIWEERKDRSNGKPIVKRSTSVRVRSIDHGAELWLKA